MQDDGQMLSCRAENPVLPNSVKDDTQQLEIYCEFWILVCETEKV